MYQMINVIIMVVVLVGDLLDDLLGGIDQQMVLVDGTYGIDKAMHKTIDIKI